MPCLALLVFLLQAPLPDFTGNWTMAAARGGSPAEAAPVPLMAFVIDQQADHISIEMRREGEKPITVLYPIVPAPKPPADPLGANMARAYWNGRQLIVERGGTISGQTVSTKQTLTMDPERDELIVERLVIVQHGYTLRGTQNYATVKDVFTRAPR
jgi:hypothetical protein